ncbi:MAG: DNA primase [Candidatus Diapherotrites archaeon]|uniref:DNA primase DnaG n=1 Tax=Candidatus Iainarchaeum sp. TaxID=3101447 RepID=A0A8T4C778_9ARCH|nr:DNA primase [Candidatus Diapherotrites archaeon]
MAKTYVDAVKYMIKIQFSIKGVVDKPDIVGAVFGQSEGLLGEEMDLRELQKKGRVGRIEVNVHPEGGNTNGEIFVPTSMDMAETSVLAAAIETVEKVGPCESQFRVMNIEDVRQNKRQDIAKRAKELLQRLKMEQTPEIDTLTEEIRSDVRVGNLIEYGRDRLAAGPEIDSSDEVIVVEGRADVVNLLKHGIKNVIGMGGSRISQDIVNLSRRKTIVLFVDGDRGGELNARKLHQIAIVPFVSVAPDGKEVEELQQKEIIQALRRRVPIQTFLDSIGVSERETNRGMRNDRGSRERGMSMHSRGRESFAPSPQHSSMRDNYYPSEGNERFPPRMNPRSPDAPRAFAGPTSRSPSGEHASVRPRFSDAGMKPLPTFELAGGAPAAEAAEKSSADSPEYAALISQVKGKKLAKFLDASKKEIASLAVKDMVEKLSSTKNVHTIVCDGIITKRLVDAAAKNNVQFIVGVKKGKIDPSSVKVIVA